MVVILSEVCEAKNLSSSAAHPCHPESPLVLRGEACLPVLGGGAGLELPTINSSPWLASGKPPVVYYSRVSPALQRLSRQADPTGAQPLLAAPSLPGLPRSYRGGTAILGCALKAKARHWICARPFRHGNRRTS